jgi:hypothetical protein
MNAISKVTDAITHPVQTAGSVASQALGITTAGVRTSARVIAWAVNQGRSAAPDAAGPRPVTVMPGVPDEAVSSPTPETSAETAVDETAPTEAANADTAPMTEAPAKKASAKKAPAKRAPAKRAPAKRAPSAKAATAGPALAMAADGEDESVPSGAPSADGASGSETGETTPSELDVEPLLDPSTAKAIRSETEVMQKASDPDKG